MEIYKPKTMPYDMKIDDALKFARKELYLVNRSLRSLDKCSDSVTYHHFSGTTLTLLVH